MSDKQELVERLRDLSQVCGDCEHPRCVAKLDAIATAWLEDKEKAVLDARIGENQLHLEAIFSSPDPNNVFLSLPFQKRLLDLKKTKEDAGNAR